MRHPLVASKTALVTGCSSGVGLATARALRQHGWLVVPTARKTEDLDRLRSEGFNAIRLEVSDSASVREAADEALRICGGQIGALVNNAGFGQPGAMEDLTRDAMRYQFEVNVFGLQELTNRFVPVMRKQGWGRIINVSSVLGRMSIPFMGIYSASKYAVEAMSDALRVELRGTGVAVSIVEPGPITTVFRDNSAGLAKSQLPFVASRFAERYRQRAAGTDPERKLSRAFAKPPEAVARKILHAVESPRPKIRYPVTLVAFAGSWMARVLPASVMDAMMSRRLV